jgi:hypothetical protein
MRTHENGFTGWLGIIFLLSLLTASNVSAQSVDPVLAGLKGLDLGVELHHDTETRLGLTADRAYKVVEEELRKAGVKFLLPSPRGTDVGGHFQRMPRDYALLYFQVAAVVDKRARQNYTIDIRYDLLDRVLLSRDSSKETIASLYKGHQLVLMTGLGGAEEVLDRLTSMAREFATNFAASNPDTKKD